MNQVVSSRPVRLNSSRIFVYTSPILSLNSMYSIPLRSDGICVPLFFGSSRKSVCKLMGVKQYNMASNKGKRAFQGARKSV